VTVHPDGGIEESQAGIRPRMLKSLIGHGHHEFAGMKQQDAQEFLIWLLSRIQRHGKPTGNVEKTLQSAERGIMTDDDGCGGYLDPTKVFKFAVQQRIQCLGCGGVKYRVDTQDNINISVPDRLRPYYLTYFLGNCSSDSEDAVPEYEPVEFEDCIKTFTAKTEIDLTCSNCQHPRATMANGFISLPDVLIITATRFVLKNWVPTKLGSSISHPPY
jgi:ubiquitin carboxyl-terminal hydrolase 5/13